MQSHGLEPHNDKKKAESIHESVLNAHLPNCQNVWNILRKKYITRPYSVISPFHLATYDKKRIYSL